MQNETGFYTNYLAIFAADDVESEPGVSFMDHNCSRLSAINIDELDRNDNRRRK